MYWRFSRRRPGAPRRADIKPAFVPLLTGLLLMISAGSHGVAADGRVDSHILFQTSPLAGYQYHAGRALFPLLRVGDPVTLIREPDNPHDPKAVRVEWRGVMIGYAPRADNVDLARIMDHGSAVEGRIVHLQRSRDPWKRVLLDILVNPGSQAPEAPGGYQE